MKRRIRITVVGDGDTGKTCLLIVYKDRKFNETYTPTIFDSYSMTIPINGQECTVILNDTAGQEDYDKLRMFAYKDTDVFILCYAVNYRDSFTNVRDKWAPELKRYCPKAKLILAATKTDLRTPNNGSTMAISEREGSRLAKTLKVDGFIENSAKLGMNIDETMRLALSAVVNPSSSKRDSYRDSNYCQML